MCCSSMADADFFSVRGRPAAPSSLDKAWRPHFFGRDGPAELVGGCNDLHGRGHPARIDSAEFPSRLYRQVAYLLRFGSADLRFDLLLVARDRLPGHARVRKGIRHAAQRRGYEPTQQVGRPGDQFLGSNDAVARAIG